MVIHGVVVAVAASLPVGLDPSTDVPIGLAILLGTLGTISRHVSTRLSSIEIEADVPTREGRGELKISI